MMWIIRLLMFVLYVLWKTKTNAFGNPCDDGNHSILPNSGLRGTACKRTDDKSICDRYVNTGPNNWYKVSGYDDRVPRKMAEGLAKMFYCGTDYPLYLPKGSHPTSDGVIVTKNACMHVGSHQCKKQYPVQIMKCGTFFIYNLTRPETCDVAYCFGENVECPTPDPCDENNRLTLPISGDRSSTCKDKSLKLCDSVLRSSWYRPMKGNVDIKMPTSCVERNSCGTESPIWLNGVEPSVTDKTVNMKACVTLGRTSACSCDRELDIQVRNCSSYLVYNLTSTPNCPERYCFGQSGRCFADVKENIYQMVDTRSINYAHMLLQGEENGSIWKNILLILLAIGVVLALLIVLACMLHRKVPIKVQAKIKIKIADDAERHRNLERKEKPVN